MPASDPDTAILVERARAGDRDAFDKLFAAALSEGKQRLADAMAALPDDERDVLLLRFFQDLALDDIAHRTGRSEAGVRRLLGRATARLGGLLAGADEGCP